MSASATNPAAGSGAPTPRASKKVLNAFELPRTEYIIDRGGTIPEDRLPTTPYTGGPWGIGDFAETKQLIALVVGQSGTPSIPIISSGHRASFEVVVNANLIAAAPELLEALTALESVARYGGLPSHEELADARAAITKALGQ